jgi:hypothetical protein
MLAFLTGGGWRMEVTCTVDTSNLMRANMLLMRHSRRSPARCINSTAYHVIKDVVDANGGFPVVAQSTIDTDMHVTVTPVVSAGSRGEVNITGNVEKTRAMMIVVARMHPNSKYSMMTGNRWPLAFPDSQGITFVGGQIGPRSPSPLERMANKINFWNYVEQVAERMVKARHSSTGFLKKSWIDLKVVLLPFAMGRNAVNAAAVTDYAQVEPAKEGYPLSVCTVSNTLGVGLKTTKELSEKYNEANHRIATPRIQAAINREFEKKVKLADSMEWAKDEPELRALGLMVQP